MFQIVTISNIGLVKKQNEDCILFNDTVINSGEECFTYDASDRNLVLAVCDGVSGNVGGDIASRLACKYLQELSNVEYDDEEKILEILRNTHQRLRDFSHENVSYSTMATTVAGVILRDNQASIFNLGDSRIYIYKFEVLRQLSTDHTLYNDLLNANMINEADTKINRHQITKFLGGKDITINPAIKINQGKIIEDEILLICSDGLTDLVNDNEIEEVIKSDDTLLNKGKTLLKKVLEREARDNVSIILVAKN